MVDSRESVIGRVVGIWRYPVKSMLGEELNATAVTERGLVGDRAFALIDAESGKAASAKNPRRWPTLFDFRAAYVEPPGVGVPLPAVRITFPDGETLTTDEPDASARLSANLGRRVNLAGAGASGVVAEGYWPDHDWLPQPNEVFDFPLPPGTFFDGATVHIVTTATLDRLRELTPTSRFEVPRFRPNLVIEPDGGGGGFVESGWVGQALTLGGVRLRVEGPCPRCVMTTLAQGSLPKDASILRTAVQQNGGNVGVYASIISGGRIRRGDGVGLACGQSTRL